MSSLSLAHVVLAAAALLLGFVISALAKGGKRHRLLGWIYVACMGVSLVAILARGAAHPAPFHGYAAAILVVLAAAALIARNRRRIPLWRSWHGALMSLSILGALTAAGGVVGGVILGVGTGPAYYRMFNAVIGSFAAVGLVAIGTRAVIWGRNATPPIRRARLIFSGIVVVLSAGLVLAQLSRTRGEPAEVVTGDAKP
jgi:uncharacterized membrane protein